METNGNRLRKYSGISLGVVMMAAFVLVQPTMMAAYAVSAQDLDWDDCEMHDITADDGDRQSPEEVVMNTIRSGNLVKTIHVEKQKLECTLNQGGLDILLDVDIYLEVWENINTTQIVSTSALVITCVKDEGTAATIGCVSYTPSKTTIPVGTDCEEFDEGEDANYDEHPMEMNTVKKGNIIKTIESQKEVFRCGLNLDDTWKKVDLVRFTEIFEDSQTRQITDVQVYDFRCVMLVTNDDDNSDSEDDVQDGIVESCVFKQVSLDEL